MGIYSELGTKPLDMQNLYIKEDGTTFWQIAELQGMKELFEGKSLLTDRGIYQRAHFVFQKKEGYELPSLELLLEEV